jgi:hypothetical protein
MNQEILSFCQTGYNCDPLSALKDTLRETEKSFYSRHLLEKDMGHR